MGRLGTSEFIERYCAAYKAGLTREEFAESIGVKSLSVYQRAWQINHDLTDPGQRQLPLLPARATKLNVGAAIVKLIGELMEEPADALPEDQDQSEDLTAEDRKNLEALGLNLLEKS